MIMKDLQEKTVSISIPFSSPQLASLAFDVLSVDKEIKGSGVTKVLSVDGTNLQICFVGEELKRLRVATNSFIKNALLIVKTIKMFN